MIGNFDSKASINPSPRTSRTESYSDFSFLRPLRKISPDCSALLIILLLNKNSIDALIADDVKGLPPNVVVCSPREKLVESLLEIIAPTGIPPARPFPIHKISGTNP